MKKQILSSLFLIAILLPISSHALVEARATYGFLASKQDISDLCQGNCAAPANAPGIVPTYGTGLDVIVNLPLMPVGIGLRYEKMGLSTSSSTIEAQANYSRTAILVNYRIINTIVHFGPIASYGVAHTGGFTVKESGVTKFDGTPGSFSSYSVGLELEVRPLIVIPLIVGAEVGLMNFQWKNTVNSVNSTSKDINMSGNYAKVFIGIDI